MTNGKDLIHNWVDPSKSCETVPRPTIKINELGAPVLYRPFPALFRARKIAVPRMSVYAIFT